MKDKTMKELATELGVNSNTLRWWLWDKGFEGKIVLAGRRAVAVFSPLQQKAIKIRLKKEPIHAGRGRPKKVNEKAAA